MATKKPAAKTAAATATKTETTTENKTMTVADLVQQVSEKSGVEKSKVKAVLDAYGELAAASLKSSDSFPVVGIGKLKAKAIPAREGRNPATGETIQIAATRRVTLSVGKGFKENVQ